MNEGNKKEARALDQLDPTRIGLSILSASGDRLYSMTNKTKVGYKHGAS